MSNLNRAHAVVILRRAGAKAVAIFSGILSIASILVVIVRPEFWQWSVFGLATAWLAVISWSYPLVRLDARDVTVRNPFFTTIIPYGRVTRISVGPYLWIDIRDGARVLAVISMGGPLRAEGSTSDHFLASRADGGSAPLPLVAWIAQTIRALAAEAPTSQPKSRRKWNWFTSMITGLLAVAWLSMLVTA